MKSCPALVVLSVLAGIRSASASVTAIDPNLGNRVEPIKMISTLMEVDFQTLPGTDSDAPAAFYFIPFDPQPAADPSEPAPQTQNDFFTVPAFVPPSPADSESSHEALIAASKESSWLLIAMGGILCVVSRRGSRRRRRPAP